MPDTTSPSFVVSDRAQAKIRSLMAREGKTTEERVRVYAERADNGRTEVGLAFDRMRSDDVEMAQSGLTLIADRQTLSIAQDFSIDFGADGFTLATDSGCESALFDE